MDVGMTLPQMVPGLDREAVLEWSRRIDAGPFSSLAIGERINFPNLEGMVTLAAAAAVTERVRLTFTVLVLPMHSAVLAAKQIATLDVVSGGRVSLGIGVGGREDDYRAVGAPFERRMARMEEQVDLMRQVWTGRHLVEGAGLPVGPPPVQAGGPEILAGSLTPKSIRRVARFADGICGFSFGPSIDEVRIGFENARNAWKDEGRGTPPRLVTGFWYALGSDAREQLDRYALRYLDFMGEPIARKLASTIRTDSEQALQDNLRSLADLGADEVILVPTSADPDQLSRVADLIA